MRFSPLLTNLVGIALAIGLATTEGILAARWMVQKFGDQPILFQFVFLAFSIALGTLFYRSGLQRPILVGYTGVPTFLGERKNWFLLSEGQHWLLPFLMKVKAVMTKLDVTEQVVNPKDHSALDKVVSKDDILMLGRYVIEYKVVDPYAYLGVNKPLEALHEIATPIFRQAIARHKSKELVREELKEEIGAEITQALRRRGHRYGFGELVGHVSVMLYPEELARALQKIRIERAERKAERFESETVFELTKRYIDELGITPQQAISALQVERGKVTATRLGFENSDKLIDAAIRLLEAVGIKKGS